MAQPKSYIKHHEIINQMSLWDEKCVNIHSLLLSLPRTISASPGGKVIAVDIKTSISQLSALFMSP